MRWGLQFDFRCFFCKCCSPYAYVWVEYPYHCTYLWPEAAACCPEPHLYSPGEAKPPPTSAGAAKAQHVFMTGAVIPLAACKFPQNKCAQYCMQIIRAVLQAPFTRMSPAFLFQEPTWFCRERRISSHCRSLTFVSVEVVHRVFLKKLKTDNAYMYTQIHTQFAAVRISSLAFFYFFTSH